MTPRKISVPHVTFRPARAVVIDGLPGFVGYDPDGVLQTTALEVQDGRITAIYTVRNPDRLRGVRELLADTSHAV